MNIENLIIGLWKSNDPAVKAYDAKFIESLGYKLAYENVALTEKQASLALKILKRHVTILNNIYGRDVLPLILNPVYKNPLRTIDSAKLIEFIKENDKNQKIRVKFPYSEEIINQIRKQKSVFFESIWDADHRAWEFSIQHETLRFCKELAETHNFQFDPEFQIFFDQITEIEKNMEKYVPMVCFVDDKLTIINSPSEKIHIDCQDPYEFLFRARSHGIKTWSDAVENRLNSDVDNRIIVEFLKSKEKEPFLINSDENAKDCISKLIKYLLPCVCFIPAGQELSKTQCMLEMVTSIGIKNTEISTMFRLPNETDSNFNKFIRENHLNSPLSGSTKIILLSQKVPKTVIQSPLKFKSAVTFSKFNAHYQTRDYLKSFYNIIEIFDKNDKNLSNNSMDWLLDV